MLAQITFPNTLTVRPRAARARRRSIRTPPPSALFAARLRRTVRAPRSRRRCRRPHRIAAGRRAARDTQNRSHGLWRLLWCKPRFFCVCFVFAPARIVRGGTGKGAFWAREESGGWARGAVWARGESGPRNGASWSIMERVKGPRLGRPRPRLGRSRPRLWSAPSSFSGRQRAGSPETIWYTPSHPAPVVQPLLPRSGPLLGQSRSLLGRSRPPRGAPRARPGCTRAHPVAPWRASVAPPACPLAPRERPGRAPGAPGRAPGAEDGHLSPSMSIYSLGGPAAEVLCFAVVRPSSLPRLQLCGMGRAPPAAASRRAPAAAAAGCAAAPAVRGGTAAAAAEARARARAR
eukprot:gene23646-biopygen19350